MRKVLLWFIKFYQRYVSQDTGVFKILGLNTPVCRYSPTCSRYTHDAILKYGILKGVFLGFKRILRCHPWASGGFDPA